MSEMRELGRREWMEVYLTDHGTVLKRALDRENIDGLYNAWRFLQALKDTGFTPKPVRLEGNEMECEYIETIKNPDSKLFHESFRHRAVELILQLQSRGIRHGDLTHTNYIMNDVTPVVIDWDQSNFDFEKRPQIKPITDAEHFYKTIFYQTGDVNRIMRRWISVRGHIKHYKGWGKLVDLGCCYGDFVALAQSERFYATGVDTCDMHSDCLDLAESRWGKWGCQFIKSDLAAIDCSDYDIALLFSVWAYIVRDEGEAEGLRVLQQLLQQVDVLFFETQLYLDGPGPEFLKVDDDTYKMLSKLGDAEAVVSLPVWGSNRVRTVWKVTK